MSGHNFENIGEFSGTLNFSKTIDSDLYLRAQFMQKLIGIEQQRTNMDKKADTKLMNL